MQRLKIQPAPLGSSRGPTKVSVHIATADIQQISASTHNQNLQAARKIAGIASITKTKSSAEQQTYTIIGVDRATVQKARERIELTVVAKLINIPSEDFRVFTQNGDALLNEIRDSSGAVIQPELRTASINPLRVEGYSADVTKAVDLISKELERIELSKIVRELKTKNLPNNSTANLGRNPDRNWQKPVTVCPINSQNSTAQKDAKLPSMPTKTFSNVNPPSHAVPSKSKTGISMPHIGFEEFDERSYDFVQDTSTNPHGNVPVINRGHWYNDTIDALTKTAALINAVREFPVVQNVFRGSGEQHPSAIDLDREVNMVRNNTPRNSAYDLTSVRWPSTSQITTNPVFRKIVDVLNQRVQFVGETEFDHILLHTRSIPGIINITTVDGISAAVTRRFVLEARSGQALIQATEAIQLESLKKSVLLPSSIQESCFTSDVLDAIKASFNVSIDVTDSSAFVFSLVVSGLYANVFNTVQTIHEMVVTQPESSRKNSRETRPDSKLQATTPILVSTPAETADSSSGKMFH